MQRERANKAAALAIEGDRAKSALAAMESRLSDLRQERTELVVRISCFANEMRRHESMKQASYVLQRKSLEKFVLIVCAMCRRV